MSKILYIMNYLFPNKLKKVSGWVFYLTLPIGLYLFITDRFEELLIVSVPQLFTDETIIGAQRESIWIENGFLDEILTALIIISGIINSFSKEKIEDELISKLRTDSLTLSLYINYSLVILATFLFYEFLYFDVLVFNLFAILLVFNLLFKIKLFNHYNS